MHSRLSRNLYIYCLASESICMEYTSCSTLVMGPTPALLKYLQSRIPETEAETGKKFCLYIGFSSTTCFFFVFMHMIASFITVCVECVQGQTRCSDKLTGYDLKFVKCFVHRLNIFLYRSQWAGASIRKCVWYDRSTWPNRACSSSSFGFKGKLYVIVISILVMCQWSTWRDQVPAFRSGVSLKF